MTNRIAHRGPDDAGFAAIDPASGRVREWAHEPPDHPVGGVLLGHRRLSILDLSADGHQPMFNDDRTLAIAYNGEVYNYVELKRQLVAAGAAFKSRTDTEVVLKAYEHWGHEAFERFIGMWALVIWDGRKRCVVVSRDRFGVKPLYLSRVGGTWLFGSEIKALLAFPGAFRGFVSENVRGFVVRNTVDVSEETFYRDILAFPPGFHAELAQGQLKKERYWRLKLDDRFEGRPTNELAGEYAELLADSVRIRMRSDVPVGTMLSGGLDSTAITALIHREKESGDGATGEPARQAVRDFQHTITACWPGWVDDEEPIVGDLWARYGLTNHKVRPAPQELGDVLVTVAGHLEEPFTNPTAMLQYLLMRRAKTLGVKVVLNGHGSDEVLAGYPWLFVEPYLADLLLSGSLAAFARNFIGFRGQGVGSTRQILRLYRKYRRQRKVWRQRGFQMGGGLPSHEIGPQTHWCQRPDAVRVDGVPSALTRVSWRVFSSHFLPKWLRMEDRFSMACSIESRLPFMDHRLVEFGFNLPDELKLRDGLTKFLLRDAMKDSLPDSITLLKKKTPFATPYGPWLGGAWKGIVEDTLLGRTRLQEHMDVSTVQKRIRASHSDESRANEDAEIWRALNAELCLKVATERDSTPETEKAT